jgi:hypothetical protein
MSIRFVRGGSTNWDCAIAALQVGHVRNFFPLPLSRSNLSITFARLQWSCFDEDAPPSDDHTYVDHWYVYIP